MSTTDPAATPEPEVTGSTPEAPRASAEPVAAEPDIADSAAPEVAEAEAEVELRRTVRIGRIIVVCIGIGMIIAALASMSFPIAEEDQYTMPQIVGFMMLIGGTFGLAIGALISLLLSLVARRKRGRGIAIQAHVR